MGYAETLQGTFTRTQRVWKPPLAKEVGLLHRVMGLFPSYLLLGPQATEAPTPTPNKVPRQPQHSQLLTMPPTVPPDGREHSGDICDICMNPPQLPIPSPQTLFCGLSHLELFSYHRAGTLHHKLQASLPMGHQVPFIRNHSQSHTSLI